MGRGTAIVGEAQGITVLCTKNDLDVAQAYPELIKRIREKLNEPGMTIGKIIKPKDGKTVFTSPEDRRLVQPFLRKDSRKFIGSHLLEQGWLGELDKELDAGSEGNQEEDGKQQQLKLLQDGIRRAVLSSKDGGLTADEIWEKLAEDSNYDDASLHLTPKKEFQAVLDAMADFEQERFWIPAYFSNKDGSKHNCEASLDFSTETNAPILIKSHDGSIMSGFDFVKSVLESQGKATKDLKPKDVHVNHWVKVASDTTVLALTLEKDQQVYNYRDHLRHLWLNRPPSEVRFVLVKSKNGHAV